jgi:hypothetical protein
VTIGQLEETPPSTYQGLRIDLPDIVDQGIPNRAGSGLALQRVVDNGSHPRPQDNRRPVRQWHSRVPTWWDLEDLDYG